MSVSCGGPDDSGLVSGSMRSLEEILSSAMQMILNSSTADF